MLAQVLLSLAPVAHLPVGMGSCHYSTQIMKAKLVTLCRLHSI